MEKSGVITKLRIKVDGIELEAEGSALDLAEMTDRVAALRRASGAMALTQTAVPRADREQSSNGTLLTSTNTIASQMNASTGSDLVMAAVAYMTLADGRETVSRREILDEMKAAKTFYKDTYSGNLTSYLDTLAKTKRLNLVARDTFALPNSERQIFDRLISDSN